MTSTLSASAEREFERRAKHKLAVLRHVDEEAPVIMSEHHHVDSLAIAARAHGDAAPTLPGRGLSRAISISNRGPRPIEFRPSRSPPCHKRSSVATLLWRSSALWSWSVSGGVL